MSGWSGHDLADVEHQRITRLGRGGQFDRGFGLVEAVGLEVGHVVRGESLAVVDDPDRREGGERALDLRPVGGDLDRGGEPPSSPRASLGVEVEPIAANLQIRDTWKVGTGIRLCSRHSVDGAA